MIAALKKAKCAHIFQDKLTGATTNRPQLARCLKTLRAGDTLIVWKLDRLGRSLRDLITMLDDIARPRHRFSIPRDLPSIRVPDYPSTQTTQTFE